MKSLPGFAGANIIGRFPQDDVMSAFAADDEADGGGGHDLICLGPGSDSAWGGTDTDVFGGGGHDTSWGLMVGAVGIEPTTSAL
jgi:Ca2+-binding RTX toxin-like protein